MIEVKKQKKRKGFTLIELMMIIGLLALTTMFIAPRFQSYAKASETLSLKEKHKLVVIAIQDWSQDNKLNFQKPGDFEVKNSQGRTVLNYLKTQEFEEKKDSANDLYLQDEDCRITFSNGVLITRNLKDRSISNVYTVFEVKDKNVDPENMELEDFEVLRGTLRYVSETNEEYNARLKIKGQKKLLLKEDNNLL